MSDRLDDIEEGQDEESTEDISVDDFASWGHLPAASPTAAGAPVDRSAVDDPSGLIQVLNDTLEDFDRRLGALELEVAETATAAKPRVVDPETVATWVTWLIDTYQLDDKIPAKWGTIPGAYQELTALCAAWIAAYDSETEMAAVGFGAAQWHDALSRTLERIQVWGNSHTTRSNRSR